MCAAPPSLNSKDISGSQHGYNKTGDVMLPTPPKTIISPCTLQHSCKSNTSKENWTENREREKEREREKGEIETETQTNKEREKREAGRERVGDGGYLVHKHSKLQKNTWKALTSSSQNTTSSHNGWQKCIQQHASKEKVSADWMFSGLHWTYKYMYYNI